MTKTLEEGRIFLHETNGGICNFPPTIKMERRRSRKMTGKEEVGVTEEPVSPSMLEYRCLQH
jgi:hypothetical protein